MSSSADDSYHSDTGDNPNTTPVTNETPGGSGTNPLTDTSISYKSPTDTDQNPVTVANPLSDTSLSDKSPSATDPTVASPISDRAAIVEVLLKFGFNFSPNADPVDEKAHRLRIDPLRQLAACFGTLTPDQHKEKFLLVKFVRNALLDSGLTVLQGHDHFFTSESPEDSAAGATGAAEDTQATIHQQFEDLQRQIKALQGSIGLQPS